jgi:hypothetical protein
MSSRAAAGDLLGVRPRLHVRAAWHQIALLGIAGLAGGSGGQFTGSSLTAQPFGRFGGGPVGTANGVDTGLDTINNGLFSWVRSHCAAVPASAYQTASSATRSTFGGSFGGQDIGQLYDCSARTSSSLHE